MLIFISQFTPSPQTCFHWLATCDTIFQSNQATMSRICVKGVGKNTNEKQLRELFSSKGEVTDVKVITSKDGKSRKFAFIGFRTDLQAAEAQKHFNNTFIGMSKISVEMAKKFNDQSLKDLKQKFAEKKSKGKNKDDSDSETDEPVPVETVKKTKDDSLVGVDTTSVAGRKKAEFLEMMKSRRNTNKWANDDVAGTGTSLDPALDKAPVLRAKTNNNGGGDDDDESAGSGQESDSESDSDNSVNDLVKGGPPAGTRPLSDLDYLRSKMKKQRSASDSDSDSESDNSKAGSDSESDSDLGTDSEGEKEEGVAKKTSSKNSVDMPNNAEAKMETTAEEPIASSTAMDTEDMEEDSGRLFVKNLPFSCTEEEFSSLFSAFGPISELHLPLDEEKRGKGYGFVQYMLPEHAEAALQALASEAFQGRVLYVVKAQKPKEKDTSATIAAVAAKGNKAKLSSFQLKKEEERRKFLNRKEGWNSAFVRSDAVVDSLAEK